MHVGLLLESRLSSVSCLRVRSSLTPEKQVRDWLRQGCDCVVIACKYDPTAAVEAMLPHLSPSRPFAVYSEFIEPLVSCLRHLQTKGTAVKLQLCDTWLREF
ncbi:unnamed protein product, partial [Hapterophycus canaliculatus]